jgi:hypothetical protein
MTKPSTILVLLILILIVFTLVVSCWINIKDSRAAIACPTNTPRPTPTVPTGVCDPCAPEAEFWIIPGCEPWLCQASTGQSLFLPIIGK